MQNRGLKHHSFHNNKNNNNNNNKDNHDDDDNNDNNKKSLKFSTGSVDCTNIGANNTIKTIFYLFVVGIWKNSCHFELVLVSACNSA